VARVEADGYNPADAERALIDFAQAVDVLDTVRADWVAAGRPSVRGGEGPSREHPLLQSMQAQQQHVSALGARLGLDPKARREMGAAGWRRGSPRAPDRAAPLRSVASIRGGLRERESRA
jgi:phage terminase small subunit